MRRRWKNAGRWAPLWHKYNHPRGPFWDPEMGFHPESGGIFMGRKTTRREDYLRIIVQLSRKGKVRGADIARIQGVSRPTVSVFLKRLAAAGDITIDSHHNISLTDQGKAVACTILDKNFTLYTLLVQLGVPEEIARQDACRMEHTLSEQSCLALKKLLEKNPSPE